MQSNIACRRALIVEAFDARKHSLLGPDIAFTTGSSERESQG